MKAVPSGSVAAVAGVAAEDCLERMDGTSLAGMPLDAIKALFRHDGRVMRVRVRRHGRPLSLDLQMLAIGN